MPTIYLKKPFSDGAVYYKIDTISDPEDEYIYEATEIAVEEETLGRDEFELTQEDLDEMYADGFKPISKEEFEKIEKEHRSLDI
ncbi:hypothetical protein QNI19_00635 [Cytophagaceae bacterium DM2B3-1]|uniref:XRE family transcriptional regulator n=1 Tax=Xanthocytophaga flava TaxID=3048013 RepID=A0ABT7CCJ3_9BACT|nr:hypothetical protein [Xanthocytophaga flavus]MDJ1470025.1 hypothetical protein [Xanthocytophaga flavus]MDJ1491411.1 hypothetical protein [Xanthocytophaga flavus]